MARPIAADPGATPSKDAFRKYATFSADVGDFGMDENQWVRFIRENGYDGGDGGLFYGDVHIVFNKQQLKGCMTFSQFSRAWQMLHVRHSGMTRKIGSKSKDEDEVDPSLASNMPVLLRETIHPPSCPYEVVQTIIKKVQTFYVTGNYSAAYSALDDARTLWLGEMEAAREAEEAAAEAARKAAEEAAEAEAAAKEKGGRRGGRGVTRGSPPGKAADKSPTRRGGKEDEGERGGGEGGGSQSASPKKRAELELPLLASIYFDLASAAVMLSDRQPDVAMTFCQQARTYSLGGLDRRHPYFTAIRLVEGVALFQKALYQQAYDLFRELKDMCLDGAGGENAAPDSGAAANNMAACCTMLGGAAQSQAMELYLEARKLLLRGSGNSDGIAIVMKAIGDLHKARTSKSKRSVHGGGAANDAPPDKGALARFLTMVVPPAPPPRPPTPPPPPEETPKGKSKGPSGPAASSKKGGKDDGKKKKKPKKKKIGPPIPPYYGLTALAIVAAKGKGKKGKKKK